MTELRKKIRKDLSTNTEIMGIYVITEDDEVFVDIPLPKMSSFFVLPLIKELLPLEYIETLKKAKSMLLFAICEVQNIDGAEIEPMDALIEIILDYDPLKMQVFFSEVIRSGRVAVINPKPRYKSVKSFKLEL